MGRLRRERKKFHLKAVGSKSGNDPEGAFVSKTDKDTALPLPSIPDSIFSGINISLDNLKFPAEDLEIDKRSVCKSAGYEECESRLSKKSKMKLRHEIFLKKLESFYQDIKERKLRKKRPSKVITWDMKPLATALPSPEELEIKEKKIKTRSRKKRSTQKAQNRQKDWLANIEAFKSTLQNSTAENNPLEIISNIVIKNYESRNYP